MATRILMRPTAQIMGDEESGIKRVVEAYEKYLPQFGYEFTENVDEVDLFISHASAMISPDVLVEESHPLLAGNGPIRIAAPFECPKRE